MTDERVYALDRIEGETEESRTAVFVADDVARIPRTLLLPLGRAQALAGVSLSEGDVCRLTFGQDGALVALAPDPAARAARERDNASRLHALFSRASRRDEPPESGGEK